MTTPARSSFACRPAVPSDLELIAQVQASSYPPGLVEDRSVLGSILSSGRDTCFVMEVADPDPAPPVLAGYILCHPSHGVDHVHALHEPPPRLLDEAGKVGPRVVFVHDAAVLPEFRGRGVGAELWRAARAREGASSSTTFQLVSVNGTRGFWERMGFREKKARDEDGGAILAPEHYANYGGGPKDVFFMQLN